MTDFIKELTGVLKDNPYRAFVFIGATLLFLSISLSEELGQYWIFFIYATVGTIWRYAEKDFRKHVLNYVESNDNDQKNKLSLAQKISLCIYQIVNIGLLFMLLKNLGFI